MKQLIIAIGIVFSMGCDKEMNPFHDPSNEPPDEVFAEKEVSTPNPVSKWWSGPKPPLNPRYRQQPRGRR